MTVIMDNRNRLVDGIYVGDAESYEEILIKSDIAKGISHPKKRTPIAQAMIDQFGYVSAKFKDKVILPSA